ncbi:PucR family transcriptional regulator [Prauserella muralis]|uniref:ABC transporter substrate-binding protein n=1 Tax=Prauserella muralis TaxID=588067 RepID=A0A2V4AHG3_9PSEU|nr:helix-turn-helix domain-containing protein [Prauserella muralis]PXY19354.1 ABC transporter substrate-binding protein [Prauserella muralis]TWE29312.1 PucR-like helix-turn-helix protein [Prauserella muralis]
MHDDAEIAERLSRVAGALGARASELTGELVALYERELPHLVHDDETMVSLLSASVYQNIDTALRIFQHGIDPSRVEAPAAALEYARRLAQRGTAVVDLIRAYYLGQMAVLDQALGEGARQISDPALLGSAMRQALTTAFTFIDRVTQQVVTAYEEERTRWMLNRSAVRAARVRTLLEEDVADLDAAEAVLGYRLRGHHVGMIAWYSEDAHPQDALAGLESLANRLGARHGGETRPLFVPHDELCAWVWLPVEKPALPEDLDTALAETDSDVRLALGEPGQGLDGFRRTHRQAQRVHALALAAGAHCDRALTFREVGAMALMTSDLAAARNWVADTLGPLAADDEQHERLRDTLRVFLATGGSYTAAASRLTMHKNSVQYRIRKAEELLGRPVSENRLDTELALRLCHRLRGAVLTGA